MYNLEINVGLNVGKEEPKGQLQLAIDLLHQNIHFSPSDCRIDKGQWQTDEGDIIEERVMIVRLEVGNVSPFLIDSMLSKLCDVLNQDAIAFKLNGVGWLAFSSTYEGERYKFNSNYFKIW